MEEVKEFNTLKNNLGLEHIFLQSGSKTTESWCFGSQLVIACETF